MEVTLTNHYEEGLPIRHGYRALLEQFAASSSRYMVIDCEDIREATLVYGNLKYHGRDFAGISIHKKAGRRRKKKQVYLKKEESAVYL
jgi:hypothetical protein